MICPYCGRELPDRSRFCAGCGAALTEPEAASTSGSVLFSSLPELPSVPDPVPPVAPYASSAVPDPAIRRTVPVPPPPVPPADLRVPRGAITEGGIYSAPSLPSAASPSRKAPADSASHPHPTPVRRSSPSPAPRASTPPAPSSPAPRVSPSSPPPQSAANAPARTAAKRSARRSSARGHRLWPILTVLLIVLLRGLPAILGARPAGITTPRPAPTAVPFSNLFQAPAAHTPAPTPGAGSFFSGVLNAVDAARPAATENAVPFSEAPEQPGARAYIDVIGLSDWVFRDGAKRYYAAETGDSYCIVTVSDSQLAELGDQRAYWRREEDSPSPPVFRLTGYTAAVDDQTREAFKTVFSLTDREYDRYFGALYLDAASP